MIKLVVLDFDDTLCLTEEATFHLENQIAKDMGFEPMERSTHKMNWGKPLELAVAERFPGIDSREFVKRLEVLHEVYASEGKVDKITDSNIDVLDHLLSRELRLAILTARGTGEVRHLLHQDHILTPRIEKFYHKDNIDFPKPDPRAFDTILSDFNVKPDEAVYLGDAPSDALCAKKAGLHFIAVLESGIRSEEDFKDMGVDFFATTFSEAVSYILAN